MRGAIELEVFLLVFGAYIAATFGLYLLIGYWALVILAPTFGPAFFGAFAVSAWVMRRL